MSDLAYTVVGAVLSVLVGSVYALLWAIYAALVRIELVLRGAHE